MDVLSIDRSVLIVVIARSAGNPPAAEIAFVRTARASSADRAAGERGDLALQLHRDVRDGDHVAHGQASARAQDAERLTEEGLLVG